MKKPRKVIQRIWTSWSEFWFRPQDLYAVALFRWIFAAVLIIMYVGRFIDIDLFYFRNGMFTPELAKAYYLESFSPWLIWFPTTDNGVLALYCSYILGLLLLFLGLLNRFVTFILWAIHLSFMQRNFAIVYGADTVSNFLLFYLSFCNHSQYFTVKSFLARQFRWFKHTVREKSDLMTSMGVRLIQVQVCVIYAYTGFEKLRGDQWWDGSALWSVMGNTQIVPLDLSFMAQLPWVIAVMTWATVVFEVYFPFAMVLKGPRRLWLALGVFMHVGAAIFMGLISFSMIMLATYILFLNAGLLRRIVHGVRSKLLLNPMEMAKRPMRA